MPCRCMSLPRMMSTPSGQRPSTAAAAEAAGRFQRVAPAAACSSRGRQRQPAGTSGACGELTRLQTPLPLGSQPGLHVPQVQPDVKVAQPSEPAHCRHGGGGAPGHGRGGAASMHALQLHRSVPNARAYREAEASWGGRGSKARLACSAAPTGGGEHGVQLSDSSAGRAAAAHSQALQGHWLDCVQVWQAAWFWPVPQATHDRLPLSR